MSAIIWTHVLTVRREHTFQLRNPCTLLTNLKCKKQVTDKDEGWHRKRKYTVVSERMTSSKGEDKVQAGLLATTKGKAKAAIVEDLALSQVSACFFGAYFNLFWLPSSQECNVCWGCGSECVWPLCSKNMKNVCTMCVLKKMYCWIHGELLHAFALDSCFWRKGKAHFPFTFPMERKPSPSHPRSRMTPISWQNASSDRRGVDSE